MQLRVRKYVFAVLLIITALGCIKLSCMFFRNYACKAFSENYFSNIRFDQNVDVCLNNLEDALNSNDVSALINLYTNAVLWEQQIYETGFLCLAYYETKNDLSVPFLAQYRSNGDCTRCISDLANGFGFLSSNLFHFIRDGYNPKNSADLNGYLLKVKQQLELLRETYDQFSFPQAIRDEKDILVYISFFEVFSEKSHVFMEGLSLS